MSIENAASIEQEFLNDLEKKLWTAVNSELWTDEQRYLDAQFPNQIENQSLRSVSNNNYQNLLSQFNLGEPVIMFSGEHATVLTGYSTSRTGIEFETFDFLN